MSAEAQFGAWTLIRFDAVGKRAVCRCRCGVVREVAADALRGGLTTSCEGCASRGSPIERENTFASRLTADQGFDARTGKWRRFR